MVLITRIGIPPTIVLSGTSLFTTQPAAITLLLPMFTLGRIITAAPINTLLPIIISPSL